MATSSRDVKLTLNVESLGQENISALEKSLRRLADTGDDSAVEFGRLADEVSRLGDQNAALQAVKALAAETADLTARQEQATRTVQEMAQRLDVLKASTEQARAAQVSARQALVEGERAYTEAGNALRTLKAEYDNAGKQTGEYRNRLQALVAAQNEARTALVGLREENRRAKEAVTAAAQEQRKAESAYKSVERGATAATAAVEKQNTALREASGTAAALGVEVQDLAAAEASLHSVFASGVRAAQARQAAIADMAEADRLAAIEAKGMADLYTRGEAALRAELMAQRDAAKAVHEYTAAKAQAVADAEAWQREADDILAMRAAQEQATRQTRLQVEVMRELAAQDAFAKQAAEAQKLVQAAEYARWWGQALDEADRQQQELTANTQRLNDAFKQINVRPIEDIQREIASTNTAMATLAASGKLTGGALAVAMGQADAKVKDLERELRQATGTMTMADKAANLLKNSMGQITAGNVVADAIGYLVNKVKEMGREFLASIVQLDSFRRALNAIYKDAAVTESQLDFLRKAAERGGVSVGGLSDSFVKFSASMKAANIPMGESNALFDSLTRAAGTLGLGSERTSLALDALGQMAAKGTVSMEELRQQLGDSIPGALSLSAKGMGITEAQLVKLVESGNLLARDFFPALTKGLRELHGETTGLVPTWERFKNMLTLTAQNSGDSGWLTLLTGALKTLAGILGIVTMGLSTLSEAMFTAGRAAIVLFESLRGNGKEALEWFNEETQKSITRLADQGRALQTTLGFSQQAAAATETLTAKTQSYMTAVDGAGRSAQAQALATKLAGDASYDAASKYVQLSVAIAEYMKAQQTETANLEKLLKARKDEGTTLVEVAKLSGDARMVREAEAKAAQMQYDVMVRLQESKREELNLLKQQLEATLTRLTAAGQTTEQIEKETEANRNKIKTLETEVEGVGQATAAAKQVVETQRLLTETYGDQSGELNNLKVAVAAYKERLTELLAEERAGKPVAEEIKVIRQQLAEALFKQRDAVNDLIEKTRIESDTKKNSLEISRLALDGEVNLLQAKAQSARNSGDLERALQLEAEAKKKAVEVARLSLEIKRIELDLEKEELRIKLENIDKSDEANAVRVKELELRKKLVDAKIKGLDAEKALLNVKSQNITSSNASAAATRTAADATDVHSDALEKLMMRYKLSADYSERQISLLEREAAAAEKAAEAYRKKWNVDKDGFTLDKNGQRMQQSLPTERYIYDTAKSQGLDEATALRLVDQFWKNGGPVGMTPGGILGPSKDWFSTVNEEVSKQVVEAARQRQREEYQNNRTSTGRQQIPMPNTSPASTSPSSSGPSQSAGLMRPQAVTININNRPRTLNMASPQDTEVLRGILRELENAGGTAS